MYEGGDRKRKRGSEEENESEQQEKKVKILSEAKTIEEKTSSVTEEVKSKFSILRELKISEGENKFFFEEVVDLIKEMAESTYSFDEKYSLMYKIIRIGNLMDILFGNEIGKIDSVKKYLDNDLFKKCNFNLLEKKTQFALFSLARNICADNFHIIYEEDSKMFCEYFIDLCKNSKNIINNVLEIDEKYSKVANFRRITNALKNGDLKENITKLLNQMGYFLKKAEELNQKGDFNGTCMALIASGTCARDFNVSKYNEVKKDSIAAILTNYRKQICHIYIEAYKKESVTELIGEAASKDSIKKIIVKIEEEARTRASPIILNIEEYYNNALREISEEDSHSPRAYKSSTFK